MPVLVEAGSWGAVQRTHVPTAVYKGTFNLEAITSHTTANFLTHRAEVLVTFTHAVQGTPSGDVASPILAQHRPVRKGIWYQHSWSDPSS